MRGLIDSGIEVHIYPLYPLDPSLWKHVPEILNESVFPRNNCHHLKLPNVLRTLPVAGIRQPGKLLKDVIAILRSAMPFGVRPIVKSAYAILHGCAVAHELVRNFDHILCYWGSYAATCAYVAHRLNGRRIPFSTFLHAADLYQDQVFLRQKLLYSDNIFVVCDFNRQYIAESYPDLYPRIAHKIHDHHLGLDFGEFPFEPVRGGQTIIGVGRFDKCKGFDDLLRAVHVLVRDGLHVRLDLIGEGDESKSLAKLARQLGIDETVRFRGWLPFEQVKNAMSEAAVLVHPSSELGDAVPTVVKEACALGTPVVGTAIAGIPELLNYGRCGIVVPARDPERMASAIKQLLTDEPARQRYAEAARKYAEEKFDLWRNGRRLANLLRSTRRIASTVPDRAADTSKQLSRAPH